MAGVTARTVGTASSGTTGGRATTDRVVLDASVVVGVLDSSDALHRPSTDAIGQARADGADFVIPATVLAEVLVGIARTDPGALQLRRDQLIAAFGPPYPIDAEVATAAAAWCGRLRALRVADALVLGVADASGAVSILTLDTRWAGYDPRVSVVRPG